MIWALEFDTLEPNFSMNLFRAALEQELSLRPLGNTVYFMSPYVINEQEIDLLIEGTLRTMESCSR